MKRKIQEKREDDFMGEKWGNEPDAGESWLDGEETQDEEWETDDLDDDCGYCEECQFCTC